MTKFVVLTTDFNLVHKVGQVFFLKIRCLSENFEHILFQVFIFAQIPEVGHELLVEDLLPGKILKDLRRSNDQIFASRWLVPDHCERTTLLHVFNKPSKLLLPQYFFILIRLSTFLEALIDSKFDQLAQLINAPLSEIKRSLFGIQALLADVQF